MHFKFKRQVYIYKVIYIIDIINNIHIHSEHQSLTSKYVTVQLCTYISYISISIYEYEVYDIVIYIFIRTLF